MTKTIALSGRRGRGKVAVVDDDDYAALVEARVRLSLRNPSRNATELIRGGGALACTMDEHIPGFRGYRYRFWKRDQEKPLSMEALCRK